MAQLSSALPSSSKQSLPTIKLGHALVGVAEGKPVGLFEGGVFRCQYNQATRILSMYVRLLVRSQCSAAQGCARTLHCIFLMLIIMVSGQQRAGVNYMS